jgi:hypothetical protein
LIPAIRANKNTGSFIAYSFSSFHAIACVILYLFIFLSLETAITEKARKALQLKNELHHEKISPCYYLDYLPRTGF